MHKKVWEIVVSVLSVCTTFIYGTQCLKTKVHFLFIMVKTCGMLSSNTYIWHRKINAACEFLWPCFDVGSLWVFLAIYTDLSSYCICYICFLVVYSNPWDTLLGKTNNMSRWDILFCSTNQKLFSGNSTGWWLLLLSKKSFYLIKEFTKIKKVKAN